MPVLVVDQRQDAGISGGGLDPAPGGVVFENRADQVGQKGARHRARRARVEVGHQRDRLLTVEWAFDDIAARGDQRAQLGRREPRS